MHMNVRKEIEYKYVVAALYAIILFLDRLNLTSVNIALPTLAKYFHIPITQTEWINNAFLLALAVSIPISGWLGDRFGDKKVFIIATGIFGASSLFCAFAPDLMWMSGLRFAQGLGGGVIIPVGMAMVYKVFEPHEYASITSYIFIPTLIAPAIAPGIGGLIIHFFSWEWIFLFVVPFCFIAVIASLFILKEQKIESNPPLDWQGFILSSCALTFILGSISFLGKTGFSLKTNSTFIAAVLFSYLFFKQEKNAKFPLVDLKLFKNKLFLQGNLIQLAFQICHFGAIFLLALYLQMGIGMSAMIAGMVMGTQAIGAICISRFAVKIFNQYGARIPLILGFMGIAVITPCILWVHDFHRLLITVIIFLYAGYLADFVEHLFKLLV